MSVRKIIVNSKVSGSPVRGDTPKKDSLTSKPEEIAFLKAENTRLEAELQASVDNLLIVVDEVKFLEDDVCIFHISTLYYYTTILLYARNTRTAQAHSHTHRNRNTA